MKAFKLIVVSLLFFAGEKLAAQNIVITNNTNLFGGAAAFSYNSPSPACSTLSVPFPAWGGQTQPYTCAANPVQVVITFNDPSCGGTPRSTGPITIGTTLPIVVTYTGCPLLSPTYTITIDNVGADWTVDIN